MATTGAKLMTAEELLAIPREDYRGWRYELIRGELTKTMSAGFDHGTQAANIVGSLWVHTRRRNVGKVATSETTFLLATDPDHARIPDVAFVRQERLSLFGKTPGAFHGPPDLAVEVISPTDRLTRVADKVQDWLEHGTRMVIVVNPRNRTVQVHTSDGVVELAEADALDGGDVVPGWSMAVADIFS